MGHQQTSVTEKSDFHLRFSTVEWDNVVQRSTASHGHFINAHVFNEVKKERLCQIFGGKNLQNSAKNIRAAREMREMSSYLSSFHCVPEVAKSSCHSCMTDHCTTYGDHFVLWKRHFLKHDRIELQQPATIKSSKAKVPTWRTLLAIRLSSHWVLKRFSVKSGSLSISTRYDTCEANEARSSNSCKAHSITETASCLKTMTRRQILLHAEVGSKNT